MTDTSDRDELAGLINETMVERETVEDRIKVLRNTVRSLLAEEAGFRAGFARKFPDARPPEKTVYAQADQWTNCAGAVLSAVTELTAINEFATPATIESFLSDAGRSDSRDAIGATLSYLKRKGRVASPSRTKWIPAN